MSFLTLLNEIITIISQKIHPSSIVSFALTCRRLAECSHTSLKLHLERHNHFRTQHDRHPLNVLNLIRIISSSPELLWYVRVFEFWGSRSSMSHWRTFTFHDSDYIFPDEKVDFTYMDPSTLQDQGVVKYINKLCPDEKLRQSFTRLIDEGSDEPLKAMLISFCPSLRKLTWIQHGSDRQPFVLLCDLVESYKHLDPKFWPAGFLSLHYISIGECTQHVHSHDNLHPNIQDFCRLLLLPNLKKLRISVAGYGDNDLGYLEEHVPRRSSSVEDIMFYVCDFDAAVLAALLERLSSLRSLVDVHTILDWADVLGPIQPSFGQSLEELRIDRGSTTMGGRLYDVSVLKGYPNLRVLDIGLEDIKASTQNSNGEWLSLDTVVPPLVQKLNIKTTSPSYHAPLSFPSIRLLCKELENFVQKRGKSHLVSVTLGISEDYIRRDQAYIPFVELFQDLRDVCGGLGVEIILDRFERSYGYEALETEPKNMELRSSGGNEDEN